MKSDKSTVFITGGGTGGHIYPAIAVADYMQPEYDIHYIGNPKNLEYDIVTNKNYKFLPVNIHGMPRKIGLSFIIWTCQLICAIIRCLYYSLKYRPKVVFGTGGYVSAPALIAAKLLRIPFVMHDCDAKPGLVTRKLAPFASGVSLAFQKACEFIKNNNIRINGNPIRAEFRTLSKEQARENLNLTDKITLCIMGGSQGAKSINSATCKILKELSSKQNIQIFFQTGKKNFNDVEAELSKNYPEYKEDKNIIVKPYFDDMVTVLKACDIAISRAGSLSISELCASGIAPIYVPYPHAASDHQRKNAKYMEVQGAGIYLEDDDVTPEKLYELITELINKPKKLRSLQENSIGLARYNGTYEIVNQIKELIKN